VKTLPKFRTAPLKEIKVKNKILLRRKQFEILYYKSPLTIIADGVFFLKFQEDVL
jgi:hypothetical protein